MKFSDLVFLPISDLAALISSKELSAVELASAYLDRIRDVNKGLNAYVAVAGEAAMESARSAERDILNGSWRGPLHGIPIAVKDNFATRGLRTSCGSAMLADWVPEFDAAAVERLKESGAAILGKTNMDEWARGGATKNLHFGNTNNPWNIQCTPGGSSGGSGVAVAAGLCAGALGTDSGGSVRNPSSLCGVVGLKPTYGRVSRYGVKGTVWSLDHVGLIVRTVRDAAIMLRVIAGHDPRDSICANQPVPDYEAGLRAEGGHVRIGVPKEPFYPYLSREVDHAVREALRILEQLGMDVIEVSLPHANAENTAAIHRTLGQAEFAAYLRKYPETRLKSLGPDVRKFVEAGEKVSAADYLAAQMSRRTLIREFQEAFNKVDVIITPTKLRVAQTWVETEAKDINIDGRMVPSSPASMSYTNVYNIAGLPAISVPCGLSASGLPIGLQIAGNAFDEIAVLKTAYMFEQQTSWHKLRPPLNC